MFASKVLLPSAMHPSLAAYNVNAQTSSGCLQILAGSVPVPPAMHSFHAALNRIFEKGRDPEKQKSWYLRVSFCFQFQMCFAAINVSTNRVECCTWLGALHADVSSWGGCVDVKQGSRWWGGGGGGGWL